MGWPPRMLQSRRPWSPLVSLCEGTGEWPGRIHHQIHVRAGSNSRLVLPSYLVCYSFLFFCFCFCLKPESPLLFPYYPRKSLHFVKRRMENVIDQCLQKPAVSLKEMHVFV